MQLENMHECECVYYESCCIFIESRSWNATSACVRRWSTCIIPHTPRETHSLHVNFSYGFEKKIKCRCCTASEINLQRTFLEYKVNWISKWQIKPRRMCAEYNGKCANDESRTVTDGLCISEIFSMHVRQRHFSPPCNKSHKPLRLNHKIPQRFFVISEFLKLHAGSSKDASPNCCARVTHRQNSVGGFASAHELIQLDSA